MKAKTLLGNRALGNRALALGISSALLIITIIEFAGNSFHAEQTAFVLCSTDRLEPNCFPAVSSTCLEGRKECTIAVAGGSLKLHDIEFAHDHGSSGTAYATGFIRGKFVSGEVHLSLPEMALSDEGAPPQEKEQLAASTKDSAKHYKSVFQSIAQKTTAEAERKTNNTPGTIPTGKGNAAAHKASAVQHKEDMTEAVAQLADADGSADAQYKAALKAVMKNIKQRQTKIGHEAEKIAKAVTKVLTSSGVSKTIADLAMDVAVRNSAPESAESTTPRRGDSAISDTNQKASDPEHFAQFGYASQPAGTIGSSVPVPLRPLSASLYHLWKAVGSPVGVETAPTQMPRQVKIRTIPPRAPSAMISRSITLPPESYAAASSHAHLNLQPKNPWLAYSEYLQQQSSS